MSYDNNVWLPRKGTKADQPSSGGAITKTFPVFGIVKDNIDPTRSGRIRVYLSGVNGKDPNDQSNWTPVNYLPPFYGYTDSTGGKTGFGSFTANPTSYGMWFSPPDIGTQVICIFVNGDPNYGFYIGAVPKPEALRMVPAIGANFTNEKVIFNEGEAKSYGNAERVPVTNMNVNNDQEANSSGFLLTPKPVHSYVASVMNQQGIIRDPIRGPIGSSSQRESPSRVGWGVSTPGRPIYEGGFTDDSIADAAGQSNTQSGLKVIGRRGGHTFVMDDGDLIGNDQLIRLRTALGHQILMSDNGQTLMILHSNGQSYIELGKEGTIDMYSTNSVNIRTQGDLNLHADNDININAAKKLNFFAESIKMESQKDFSQKVGTDSSVYTMGKHTHKVDSAMSFASEGDASFASPGTTYINGSKRINLNTGETSTTPEKVSSFKIIAQTDTLYDPDKGFIAAPAKLPTIASRAPAHYPWTNAGQGVDVKTDLNASSQLPASASSAVDSANAAAGPVDPAQAVTSAGIATVPPTSAVSKAIDKGATGALVSAAGQIAATGPAAAAVAAGAGIVTDAAGKASVAIGATALNPTQLEKAGTLKPGSATTINGIVQQGGNLAQAMSSNFFTGKDGVKDLPGLVNNIQAQTNATVNVLQNAQTSLTNAGAITGKEGAGAVAGAVLAGATAGVGQTLNTIKNAGNNIAGAAAGAAGAANDAVNKAMSAGNFAANTAQNGINGLAGVSASIGKTFASIADSAKGVAASAFNAIKNTFKSFPAGVPVDISATNAANQAASEAKGLAGAANAIGGIAKTAIGGALAPITGAIGGITSGVNAITNASAGAVAGGVAGVTGAVKNIGSTVAGAITAPVLAAGSKIASGVNAISTAASKASGVSNLPGGENAVASVTNLLNPQASIPATGAVKSFIDNATTAATNGISSAAASLSSLPAGDKISSALGGDLQSKAAGLANAGNDLANKLKAGGAGLASLASAGLPSGLASKLQSQIAAISSVGESQVGLPSVATDTVDRSAIAGQINANLGDKRIPAPNFSGEVSPSATKTAQQQLEETREKVKQTREISAKLAAKRKEFYAQKAVVENAIATLPEGDPTITAERAKFRAIFDEMQVLYNSMPSFS